MEWSPRENKLACGTLEGQLLLLDPETPEAVVLRREISKDFWGVCWSPDGTRLALRCATGKTIIYTLPDLKPNSNFTVPIAPGQQHRYGSTIQWSADGKRLLAQGRCLVELNDTGEPKCTMLPSDKFFSFLPDGDLITYARRGTDVVALTLKPNDGQAVKQAWATYVQPQF